MIIGNTNYSLSDPQILDKKVPMLHEKRAISGSTGFYSLLFLRIEEHI